MQFLIFSKNDRHPENGSVIEWIPSSRDEIISKIAVNGSVCLINREIFERLEKVIKEIPFINCGLKSKNDKIELYRALKFDNKRDRSCPKRIIFNVEDAGALKRSLTPFFTHRYTAADPCCLIIIPGSVLQILINETIKKQDKRNRLRNSSHKDPISNLIEETVDNPAIVEMEKTYIGNSYAMKLARALILKASQSISPVLILGETGTGKDVIAHLINVNSKVYKKPYTIINCAALPEQLLESELFGHEAGSFTGANKKKDGLFVASRGGTIFLDEIGDMTLANQVKILLAIDKKIIRRVGSNKTIDVDVRVIAATNRNVDHMALNGTFRDDLLYRLNSFRILASALRNHPEDIPAIADHLWARQSKNHRLSKEFHQHLQSYPWPGNVRELKTMLNSIVDIFGDISPTPAHIDAIRKARQENLNKLVNNPVDDKTQLLFLEAKNRLIKLQNIIRGIKISMRPVINRELIEKKCANELGAIRKFIEQQIDPIEELCREPVYFKVYKLFKQTTRYRYLLEKTLKNWPESCEKLNSVWMGELDGLHDAINTKILELIWGGINNIDT